MKEKIAKICHVLGFASIAFSAYCYNAYGIADATYVGLWVPSFFLVGNFFACKSHCKKK